MSGDENKSLQQNLPLSWEEDSQNNFDEQEPPKKLLLKREEPEVPEEAPKPLLLKKAPVEEEVSEETEEVYRKELDSLDTIYDKEIPPEEEATEDLEEEYELEEAEWNDSEQDYQDLIDEEVGEFEEGSSQLEEFEEEAEEAEDTDPEESNEIQSEETQDSLEEDGVEENESDDYESAFQDSGTFTLDETVEEESEEDIFQEDDTEENRISIPEEVLDAKEETDSEAALEEEVDSEAAPEEEISEETPQTVEESVFALKADTFYEVQTEAKDEESSDLDQTHDDSTPAEVIQDYEVQSLGALLQEARLACSFTIKDAAEATRIKSSYIIALENNEMDELPAKVYVLNYIRQLCREYNIANEPIITAFERQHETNENGGDVKIMRVGDEDARKATKPNSKLNALVVGTSLLTLIMLFLIGWYMKWFNTGSNPETLKIEVNLEEVRPAVKLPAPELPIPSQ